MKNGLKHTGIWISMLLLAGCTPDDLPMVDNTGIDINTAKGLRITQSHLMLLADGRATLDMNPTLYNHDSLPVADNRIKDEWFEYHCLTGEKVSRHFSTSDASLIGKTLQVYARIKGRDIVSDTVSFTVKAPVAAEACREMTIPVIFHIVQTNKDLTSYGGAFPAEKIYQVLQKMNRVLAAGVSTNAMGANTKITFKPALYNEKGKKLLEEGINRLNVEEIKFEDGCGTFIKEQKLIWPAEKYMNIWLIADRKNSTPDFGSKISASCFPRYLYPDTEPTTPIAGLTFTKRDNVNGLQPREVGLLYKLNSLNSTNTSIDSKVDNELIHYLGYYLGLLPTSSDDKTKVDMITDYCDDTIDYYNASDDNLESDEKNPAFRDNRTEMKEAKGCFFLSENIMDDQAGMHRSVSVQQSERMHWVLANCPERAAWKSDFAFTGKE